MATFKTPGVYIEEIQTLAPSVAPVPTSIPGFVGYTEKALFPDGSSALMKPVRITSLLEFEQIFGAAFPEQFTVTLTDGSPTNFSVVPTGTLSEYILYYQLRMFYANGGGTCYIVSVDNYPTALDFNDLKDGAALLEQIDEITLLVVPESVFGDDGERLDINTALISQAAKLQDRFAVLDVVHENGNTILQDADNFRNDNTTADNLKYAAAYYPALKTTQNYFYKDTEVTIDDNRISPPAIYVPPYDKLNFIHNGFFAAAVQATGTITVDDYTQFSAAETITIYGTSLEAVVGPPGTDEFEFITSNNATATSIYNAITTSPTLSTLVTASLNGATITLTRITPGVIGNNLITTTNTTDAVILTGMSQGADAINIPADTALYNSISSELAKYKLNLYPSSAMVGIYARIDDSRGVWQAPANVGVNLVTEPTIAITSQDQENLNVDSVSGKSINVIRKFTGRGNLVWGARTLAGNDNEWRYVNVRRLFIFAEESIKKATEFVVFEPNTATTWSRVRGMAESFLTGLWRDGALAGATTQEAFFVKVGLGTTMTPQDILEGRMIVEIGLAAVRPAEFIILRFSHKLQES